MKLGTRESRASSSVRALADDLPSTEVGEGPVLVKGGAQEVVPSWVQTDARHRITVGLGRGGEERGGEVGDGASDDPWYAKCVYVTLMMVLGAALSTSHTLMVESGDAETTLFPDMWYSTLVTFFVWPFSVAVICSGMDQGLEQLRVSPCNCLPARSADRRQPHFCHSLQ